MIFLRRENFRQYLRLYPVTSLILLAIIVVFVWMEIDGSSTDSWTLLKFGAMYNIEGVVPPEWWRYVTAIFLHIGWEHLLFNAFAIYVFAAPLERLMGHLPYAIFFLLCGVGGNVLSYWLAGKTMISAGASGAIYGVYAAFLYLALFYKHVLDNDSGQVIKVIVIVGFINSLLPHINLLGHLGGFLTGLLICAILSLRYRRR